MSLTQVKPMREDPPLTVSSIEAAKRQQAEDRQQATAECGIHFAHDGTPYLPAKVVAMSVVGPRRVPWNDQLDCDEGVDKLVETHGLDTVIRSIRLVAAVNGRTI